MWNLLPHHSGNLKLPLCCRIEVVPPTTTSHTPANTYTGLPDFLRPPTALLGYLWYDALTLLIWELWNLSVFRTPIILYTAAISPTRSHFRVPS